MNRNRNFKLISQETLIKKNKNSWIHEFRVVSLKDKRLFYFNLIIHTYLVMKQKK